MPNPSFENKIDTVEFKYHLAEKTLAKWNYLQFRSTFLYHPTAAVYIDTTLFERFASEGFPIRPSDRELIARPYNGVCYIKSNTRGRALFQPQLQYPLKEGKPYIIVFKYQHRSITKEWNLIETANFGVSFLKNMPSIERLRNPKYKSKLAPFFIEHIFLSKNNHQSKDHSTWQNFSSCFNAYREYKYIQIGNHTDFKSNAPEKNKSEKNTKENASFIFFIDNVELYSLDNFLKLDLSNYKGVLVQLPFFFVDKSISSTTLQNNEYFQKFKKAYQRASQDISISVFIDLPDNSSSDILYKLKSEFEALSIKVKEVKYLDKKQLIYKKANPLKLNTNITIIIN
jgi:hypothetical protein